MAPAEHRGVETSAEFKTESAMTRASRFVSPATAVMIFLVGCASSPTPPVSGFLGNYDGFEADPADGSLLWWERPTFDWSSYRALMLDPLSIYYHPQARGREILPEELTKLTDAFREAVVEELGADYRVVEQSGPDVLRVHAAITDVIPTKAALNVVTSVVAFVPVNMGGAAIEVEFLDSETGERLAAGVDQKLGTPFDGVAGFTRLGHAKDAFREWAHELRVALDTNP
jgi:hypothetical protein